MPELDDFKNGKVLLIDKPLTWTSFQVVNKIRWHISRYFKIKKIKVGHAGTLDPLATGLLILCTGKMTKQIETFQGQEKEYEGALMLGSTTPSYDLETEIDANYPIDHIDGPLLKSVAETFEGDIMQLPPMFSAVKQDGKRLYELARKGQTTELKARPVSISKFEILDFKDNTVRFRVVCSKGTYIRSLVHDFGKALDSGAHLIELRRTRIGDFKVEDAQSIDEFISWLKTE